MLTHIDDILITSSTPEEHQQHLIAVFEHFKEYGVIIGLSKCEFGVNQLTFLGHKAPNHYQIKCKLYSSFHSPLLNKSLENSLGLSTFITALSHTVQTFSDHFTTY